MNKKDNFRDIRIGVIGAGSWGTAIANLLAIKGFKVNQWIFESEVLEDIKIFDENKKFLPGIKLSKNLKPSNDLELVARDKDLLIIATPSHVLRDIVTKIVNLISTETILVSVSKGIENITYLTMSNVIKSIIPTLRDDKIAILTGPSFAREVAKQIPTLVTLASKNLELSLFLQNLFATKYFRVYTIDDVIGAEIGGSIKNVIAIAAGVIDGLGLGLNTRAALITRGLAEITRLGLALGGKANTFSGLAGVGDLVLTCTGTLSRNYSMGKKIGQGEELTNIINKMDMVVEGLNTAKSVYNLSKKVGIEMPISQAVYRVLYKGLSPIQGINNLMTRELKQEFDY